MQERQILLKKNLDKRIILERDDIEIVDRFSYVGDVHSTERVQVAVITRVRSAWKRLKEFLHKSYLQSTLSYGAECWVMRVVDERKLKKTEVSMLHVLWSKP